MLENSLARVYERLVSQVLSRKLKDIGLENTPQHDPYVDETQNKMTFPQLAEKLEPMLQVGGHYVGADIAV